MLIMFVGSTPTIRPTLSAFRPTRRPFPPPSRSQARPSVPVATLSSLTSCWAPVNAPAVVFRLLCLPVFPNLLARPRHPSTVRNHHPPLPPVTSSPKKMSNVPGPPSSPTPLLTRSRQLPAQLRHCLPRLRVGLRRLLGGSLATSRAMHPSCRVLRRWSKLPRRPRHRHHLPNSRPVRHSTNPAAAATMTTNRTPLASLCRRVSASLCSTPWCSVALVPSPPCLARPLTMVLAARCLTTPRPLPTRHCSKLGWPTAWGCGACRLCSR
mmetsp:Transcript_1830/g.5832  ORF Transcript_1830/g.5832 Transcript_1830/m.5832 type:complete len:267 (-) Transcript_1830:478-1278(-)